MLRRFGLNFGILSIAVDAGIIALALVLAEQWRPELVWLPGSRVIGPEVRLPQFLFLAAPLLWIVTFALFSLYDPRVVLKATGELRVVVLGSAFATLATAGLLYLSYRDVSRWLFVLFAVTALLLLCSWRVSVRIVAKVRRTASTVRRVILVGTGEVARQVGALIEQHEWAGLRLIGYLGDDSPAVALNAPYLGTVGEIRAVVQAKQVDEVVVAPPFEYAEIEDVVKSLLDIPLHVRAIPASSMLAVDRPAIEDFAGIPMLDLRAGPLTEYQRVIKRVFDLFVGTFVSVVASPVMAAAVVAIKLDSPGPALFRQQRVGENGRLFTMYKFRSMVVNAEQLQGAVTQRDDDGNVVHKHKDDPRVTRVGRFLRRTSIDELPQLFNILRGEMTLVGPRPELPWLVERYSPWQRRRLVVPPGVTGWWQINGRSERLMHLHTDDDIYYIANYSFWLDLSILWRTFRVVIEGRGAH